MGRRWTEFEDTIIKHNSDLFSKTATKLAREIYNEYRAKGYLRTLHSIRNRINIIKKNKIKSNIKGASYKPEWHKNDNVIDVQDSSYIKKLMRYKFLYHLEILKKTFKYNKPEDIDWRNIEKLTSILNATSREMMEEK